jgi:hypothetical protein
MTDSENLPAEWNPVSSEGSRSDTDGVTPGTWWRLTGAVNDLEKREAPDHGQIFLLGEARIIDGEIHTVVLHEHPLYGSGTYKVLTEEFLINFTPEQNGEALREVELSAIMGDITDITSDLSNPPSDVELLKALPPPPVDSVAKTETRSVPAVLLPNGDIDAAQRKIEQALAVVESRKNWVETRTEALKEKMYLVSRYQTEKVSVGLAGISEQRKWAETMLENVQTMRLWLGDEQFFSTLVEGESADPDEPLHFMQRMLYLDEEIFTHARLDGFTCEELDDLGQILTANPDLVARMMPHPRCVVIAKVRRKTRPFEMPKNISDIFSMMHGMEGDKLIQILVRNGEQVHLITTDEITSKANRLFPSKAEIDAIFTEKASFRSEARMITPHDIEYSDKRADHDSRALFYKRILLILWGLSEREGILGNFIGEGVNWLEETVHHKAFRFVHDEEGTIGDGRMPVLEYIRKNRASVRSGSCILANWKALIGEDTADHLYEPNSHSSGYRHRRSDPVDDFSITFASKRGRELVVPCEVTKYSYSSTRQRTYNTKVRISWEHVSYAKRSTYVPGGFLCMDDVRAEDLRYYFESRIHREHYLEYIHLFDRALAYLEADEEACRIAEKDVVQSAGVSDEEAKQALTLWRGGNKAILPDTLKQMVKIDDLAKLIQTGYGDLAESAIYIDLTSSGLLEVAKLHTMDLFDLDLNFALVNTYSYTKRKGWVRKGMKTVEIDTHAGPGRLRLYENLDPAVLEGISKAPLPLADPQAAMRVYCGPEWDVTEDRLLQLIKGDETIDCEALLDECVAWSRSQSGSTVEFPQISRTIGYAFDPGDHGKQLYRFELYVYPVLQVLNLGHEDLIAKMVEENYRTPIRGLRRLIEQLDIKKVKSGGPYGIKVFRVGGSEEITKDSSFEKSQAVEVSRACLLLPGAGRTNDPDQNKFFPKSLREIFVIDTAYAGYYRAPETKAAMSERVNLLEFRLKPGFEQLIKDMTGLDLDKVSPE